MSDFVDSQTHKAKIWSAPYLLYRILVFHFSRVRCRAVTYSYVWVGVLCNVARRYNGIFFTVISE